MTEEENDWSNVDNSFRQIHSSGSGYENIQTFKKDSMKYLLRKYFVFIF